MIQNEESNYQIIKLSGLHLPKSYEALIYSKFLRSLRDGNSYFKLVDSDPYYRAYHCYIENLLKKPEVVLRFAVLLDDHDVVLGWAMFEPSKLHYIYVNKENRKIGIAKSLINDMKIDTITHLTHLGLELWPKKLPMAKFNPF